MLDLFDGILAARFCGEGSSPTPPTPVLIEKTVTANGTYDASDDGADGYSSVDVEVPASVLTTKAITANGAYNASSDNADGYSAVTVNVYNFFDGARTDGIKDNKYLNQSGQEVSSNDYYISYPIPVLAGKVYEWFFGRSATHQSPTVGFYDNLDNLISVASHGASQQFTFTVPANAHHIRASVYKINKAVAMLRAVY